MAQIQPENYIGETEQNLGGLSDGEGEEWITTTQVAQLTGYNQEYIRRLLRTGKVVGKKWGRDWMVEFASLRAYMQAREVRKPRGDLQKPKNRL